MENEIFFDSLFSYPNPISGKTLCQVVDLKMLPCNQIARFFKHQNLWKESVGILDFFLRGDSHYSHYRKTAAETSFWLGVVRYDQPRSNIPRLTRVLSIGLRVWSG